MTQTLSFTRRRFALLTMGAITASSAGPAQADDRAAAITRDALAARDRLYAANPKAKALGASALAVLVFPKITKAGAMVGGMRGDGAMLAGDKVRGFYRIRAASFGWQLGAQTYGYAIFLMNNNALANLSKSGGWAVGSSPSLVIVDEGFARSMNTTTLSKDVYAMAFGQHGLMAGSGLEGSNIAEIHPDA